MTIIITQKVPEESSAGFEVSFLDESGAAITPAAVSWTLTDRAGTVINSRSAVSVTPASVVTIVLSGDDLALNRDPVRLLLVEATYNSSLGAGLPFREDIRFQISPLAGV